MPGQPFTSIQRTLRIAAVALALVAMLAGTTQAATTSTSSTRLPVTESGFISCARNGAGDYVEMSGEIHIVGHNTLNDDGSTHTLFHINYQNVSGTGLLSGDSYHASSAAQSNVNAKTLPYTFDFIDNFHVVGQGPGNDFMVHTNMHFTVNANGELTAYVDELRLECRSPGNTPTPTPVPTPSPYPAP